MRAGNVRRPFQRQQLPESKQLCGEECPAPADLDLLGVAAELPSLCPSRPERRAAQGSLPSDVETETPWAKPSLQLEGTVVGVHSKRLCRGPDGEACPVAEWQPSQPAGPLWKSTLPSPRLSALPFSRTPPQRSGEGTCWRALQDLEPGALAGSLAWGHAGPSAQPWCRGAFLRELEAPSTPSSSALQSSESGVLRGSCYDDLSRSRRGQLAN